MPNEGRRNVQTINENREAGMIFDTLNVKRESAVTFVEIAAPPMNLLGQN